MSIFGNPVTLGGGGGGGIGSGVAALVHGGYLNEYAGCIYGNDSILSAGGLVLLGDFSQGGQASGNALLDSIANYSAVFLQGVYNGQRTSSYNTSMLYFPVLNTPYWAGMKDRNGSYSCNVTFTDSLTASLDGNRQVIIYGVP